MTSSVVATLGLLSATGILYALYCLFDIFALHFFLSLRPLEAYKRAGSDGAWALVTGASAGIGLGVATELAKTGFGVILLGHMQDELDEVKEQIEASIPGAAVKILVLDVCNTTTAEIADMVKSVEHLKITILVNNVGGVPVPFPTLRDLVSFQIDEVDRVIELNVRFMARLTNLMLPMLSRQPQSTSERCLIINTSSGSYPGLPWVVLYSSCKAFVRSFSHALSRELAQSKATQHIDCLALVPGDVNTAGNPEGNPPGTPDRMQYGKLLVSRVDGAVRRGMRDMVPFWKHDLQIRMLPMLSDWVLTDQSAQIMRGKMAAYAETAKGKGSRKDQ